MNDLDRISELNDLGQRLLERGEVHLERSRKDRFRWKWRQIGRTEGLTEAFMELNKLEQKWMAEVRREVLE